MGQRVEFLAFGIKMHSSFITSLLLFICFLLLTFSLPPQGPMTGRYGSFASLIDKHRRLRKLGSPKIVFVGGSNLVYGLDSGLVEKTLHMPAVNMSECLPFGLRYMLEEIKDDIAAGDIIVIVPEYTLLYEFVEGDHHLLKLLETYPGAGLWLFRSCLNSPSFTATFIKNASIEPAAKWRELFTVLVKMWQDKRFNKDLLYSPLHTRYFFEEHGDHFMHLFYPVKRPNYQSYEAPVAPISDEGAKVINDFAQFAHRRLAYVVLIPSPIPETSYKLYNPRIFADWPGQKLSVPILARPERYVFSDDDFFEYPYHLNSVSRAERTNRLIEDLSKFIDQIKEKPNHLSIKRQNPKRFS